MIKVTNVYRKNGKSYQFFGIKFELGLLLFDALTLTDGSTLFNFSQCSYLKFFGRKDVAISFFLHSQKLGNNKIMLLIYFNTWFSSVFFQIDFCQFNVIV